MSGLIEQNSSNMQETVVGLSSHQEDHIMMMFPERDSTPERTTPVVKKETGVGGGQGAGSGLH